MFEFNFTFCGYFSIGLIVRLCCNWSWSFSHGSMSRKDKTYWLNLWDVALYHLDFVVKVRGRSKGDGLLLLENKRPHLLNYDDTILKIYVSHKTYGRPLIITMENSRWMTVRYNDRNSKNEIKSVFRIEAMTEY